MPSKLYDPSKPTFYLDQSTLCDAFRAHDSVKPSDAAYRPLLPWIERIAREANLCVSLIHISELAKWTDVKMANAFAAWLDGLPLFRVAIRFNEGFVAGVMRREAGSKKDREALSGSFHDSLHLVGAAYCDVFTCDKGTSESLGGFRAQIGRQCQLAVRGHAGGIQGFVEALIANWP